jgi:hypothetical protein
MIKFREYSFRNINSFNAGNLDGLTEFGEKPGTMDEMKFYFRNSLIDEMLEKKMMIEAGKDENGNQLYCLSNYDSNTAIELNLLALRAILEMSSDIEKNR